MKVSLENIRFGVAGICALFALLGSACAAEVGAPTDPMDGEASTVSPLEVRSPTPTPGPRATPAPVVPPVPAPPAPLCARPSIDELVDAIVGCFDGATVAARKACFEAYVAPTAHLFVPDPNRPAQLVDVGDLVSALSGLTYHPGPSTARALVAKTQYVVESPDSYKGPMTSGAFPGTRLCSIDVWTTTQDAAHCWKITRLESRYQALNTGNCDALAARTNANVATPR